MSFLRHGKSIKSDAGENAEGRTVPAPAPSASMSFSWLFLGGVVSTRARLRFTNRGHYAVHSVRRSSLLQRTANYLLTVCLTPGDKRNSIFPFHLCHPFLPPFVLLPKGHKLIHVPQPICDASGHRRAHAQCTMNLDEVVSEIIERDGSRVILQLAAESTLCNCAKSACPPNASSITFT